MWATEKSLCTKEIILLPDDQYSQQNFLIVSVDKNISFKWHPNNHVAHYPNVLLYKWTEEEQDCTGANMLFVRVKV